MSWLGELAFDESDTAAVIIRYFKPTGPSTDRILARKNHIATCVNCPRKFILDTQSEEDDLSTENKLRGTSMHSALQKGQTLTEYTITWDGVEGHIDILLDKPIEIYTTQRYADFSPVAYPYKVCQLLGYIKMLMENNILKVPVGEVLVFYILKFSSKKQNVKKLRSWIVYPDEEMLTKNWANIKYNQKEIDRYLETGMMPDMNPLVTPEYNECRTCSHNDFCYGSLEPPEDSGTTVTTDEKGEKVVI